MEPHTRLHQEWRRIGLPLTTASEEACKLYDAVITQYTGWYDDPTVGGLGGALAKLAAADPDFLMGQVVANGLEAFSAGRLAPSYKASIERMLKLAEKPGFSDREKKHATAVALFADGQMKAAAHTWEDILLDHPTDVLALKFASFDYFYQGETVQLRDSIARVLPHWTPSMPLYGYVLGMHAFGLEETNLYPEAEAAARKALEMNPRDGWATHSICHVMEMTGRQEEGIKMMGDTEQLWTTAGMIAGHNFWHWALYYIELGDYESALSIFDEQMAARAHNPDHMQSIDLVDIVSLLFRLEMEGVNIGDRWDGVYAYCKSHLHDHLFIFNDIHILLSCLRSGHRDAAQEMMESIHKFVIEGKGTNKEVVAEVGETLCKAFLAYQDGDYATAVDLMVPIRYKVIRIGGSHAQRDWINLFLIQAAIKSSEHKHHKLARSLLNERKVWKPNAPMTDRLMAKAIEAHAA